MMIVQRLWASALIPILLSLTLCSNFAQAQSPPSEAYLEQLAQAYDRIAHAQELNARNAELCAEAHREHAALYEKAAQLRFRAHWFKDRRRDGTPQTLSEVYGILSEQERSASEHCLQDAERWRGFAESNWEKADLVRDESVWEEERNAIGHREFAELYRSSSESTLAVAGHARERAEKYREQAKTHRRLGETEHADLSELFAAVNERLAAVDMIEAGIKVQLAAGHANFAAALDRIEH